MQQDRRGQQLQKPDVKNEANKDNFVDQSRRKTLKKIAVGGAVAGVLALTGKWSKPVVDSIILPAHAQATGQE
jgi:hypothetical protein